MNIGGVSIIFLFGILNFILLLFQLSSGLHWIKVRMGLHKKTGIALFISAILHATLALLTL